MEGVSPEEASKNFVKAIGKGLLKVISKMGISTLFSYCGAQIFEAVGLNEEFIRQALHRHRLARRGRRPRGDRPARPWSATGAAFAAVEDDAEELEVGGEYQLRHAGPVPPVEPGQHPAAAAGRQDGRLRDLQGVLATTSTSRRARYSTLRGLFEFDGDPIPLEEVEPAKEIVKRFVDGRDVVRLHLARRRTRRSPSP